MVNPDDDTSYNQGRRDARLDGHDNALIRIRNDIAKVVDLVTGLKLETQRLGDNAKASAEATIKLAEAVNAEKINARETLAAKVDETDRAADTASDKFTRRDKMIALLIGAGTLVVTVYTSRGR